MRRLTSDERSRMDRYLTETSLAVLISVERLSV